MLEIDRFLSVAVPDAVRVPIHYMTQRFSGRCDPMIPRLDRFILRKGRSIDVGANQGMYTFRLAALSTAVDAFEPQPVCARRLRAYAKVFAHNVDVHEVGLSQCSGLLELRVPTVTGRFGNIKLTGRASFDLQFRDHESLEVPIRTLDSFRFSDVCFVKIDVEGHEHNVIDGARQTLKRCRPTILVEIEQRYLGERLLTFTFEQLLQLGYSGGFYFEGQPLPLASFRYELHQKPYLKDVDAGVFSERYVNNFVFWPSELGISHL